MSIIIKKGNNAVEIDSFNQMVSKPRVSFTSVILRALHIALLQATQPSQFN